MSIETLGNMLQIAVFGGLILAGVLVILIWVKNKTKNISTLRLFVQIVFIPLIFLGLFIGPFGLPQNPNISLLVS
jgi:prolipoprotein diacylglyceryltransferase